MAFNTQDETDEFLIDNYTRAQNKLRN